MLLRFWTSWTVEVSVRSGSQHHGEAAKKPQEHLLFGVCWTESPSTTTDAFRLVTSNFKPALICFIFTVGVGFADGGLCFKLCQHCWGFCPKQKTNARRKRSLNDAPPPPTEEETRWQSMDWRPSGPGLGLRTKRKAPAASWHFKVSDELHSSDPWVSPLLTVWIIYKKTSQTFGFFFSQRCIFTAVQCCFYSFYSQVRVVQTVDLMQRVATVGKQSCYGELLLMLQILVVLSFLLPVVVRGCGTAFTTHVSVTILYGRWIILQACKIKFRDSSWSTSYIL